MITDGVHWMRVSVISAIVSSGAKDGDSGPVGMTYRMMGTLPLNALRYWSKVLRIRCHLYSVYAGKKDAHFWEGIFQLTAVDMLCLKRIHYVTMTRMYRGND